MVSILGSVIERPDSPMTIGVYGDWSAGKSSVLDTTEEGWQVQTVAPNRICLQCIGAYDPHEVSLEKDGLLDDPTYIIGLPKEQ